MNYAGLLNGIKFTVRHPDTDKPLSFGKVFTYEQGTTTPKQTWTNELKTSANTNPVILDAFGQCNLYLDGKYRIVIKDKDDVQIDTVDYIRDPATIARDFTEEILNAYAELALDPTNLNTVATNISSVNTTAINIQAVIDAYDNATTSTTQAGIATDQATIATTQANTATTKASEASASATSASNSATSASNSATTATTKANEANNSATTATTKANEASASATTATNQATTATTKASEASASATSANNSATTATTKASEASASATSASNSATSASNSATTATTKANEASASATSASGYATSASNSATSASNSADTATTQAGIATTKASEASTSASNALASETMADKWANNPENIEVTIGKYSAYHWSQKAKDFASGSALTVIYDNTTSGLTATNVQTAIDELSAEKAELTSLTTHTGNTSNPHSVTKTQVGLGNVDNTSDLNKPISTATQTALNGKANKATTLSGYGITDAYTKTEVGTVLDFTTALG